MIRPSIQALAAMMALIQLLEVCEKLEPVNLKRRQK